MLIYVVISGYYIECTVLFLQALKVKLLSKYYPEA